MFMPYTHFKSSSTNTEKGRQRKGNTKATGELSREESVREDTDKKSEMLDVRSLRRIDEAERRGAAESLNITHCQHCLLETSLIFREM